jgi:Plasmid maintenance system antidote protein
VDDLAGRLNQIMVQRGLKASEIADATGITRPAMSRYLANRSGISAENLIKLSQYLNVSPDWLLNGSDAPESIKMSTSISVDKNETIAVLKKYVANLEKTGGWFRKKRSKHGKILQLKFLKRRIRKLKPPPSRINRRWGL